jgi:hypothetical protein
MSHKSSDASSTISTSGLFRPLPSGNQYTQAERGRILQLDEEIETLQRWFYESRGAYHTDEYKSNTATLLQKTIELNEILNNPQPSTNK